MNKSELVRVVAKATKEPRWRVERILDSIIRMIELNLEHGESVTIHRFGRFEKKKHTSTRRKNPKTQEWIEVSSKDRVSFYPTEILRKKVSGETES